MAGPDFDVTYLEQRSRGSVAIRLLLAIPHLLLVSLWSYVVGITAVFQWFVILFTGRRSEGLFNFHNSALCYMARTYSYAGLLHDTFPGFAAEWNGEPVHFRLPYRAEAKRLSSFFRYLWAIPAMIVIGLVGIALYAVVIVAWFVIVLTGRLPRGMFEFMVQCGRLSLALQAYLLLQTDEYPLGAWNAATPGGLPPGDFSKEAVAAGDRWSPPGGQRFG